MLYQVTSIDKYHGRNSHVSTLEVPENTDTTRQFGALLRAARILSPGQSVHTARLNPINGQIILFPNNAPGRTTGVHSITLHPSLGCEPRSGE